MKTLQDDGDFLQLLISFSMLSVTTVISLNSGNLPSFYQWLDMRRGRFLSYWTLSINNFSWLEFTWLQSLMIGLCSLTDGFGIWICIRYWNRRSIVQTRCPIDMCKCWIRLRDLRHLFLHLQQKIKSTKQCRSHHDGNRFDPDSTFTKGRAAAGFLFEKTSGYWGL